MPGITSANVAQAIVKRVAADALPALMGTLVMGNLVNRDYEPVLAEAGDTVNVPIPPILVANNIAEGGSVTTQAPSLGNAQIVLNTHSEATFLIPDVTKALAVPDLMKVYLQPAIIALAESIETGLLGLYPFFTFNAATGATTAMDEARIDLAEQELYDAKIPVSETRFLLTSSTAFSQMRQIPRFSEYQTVGPDVQSAGGSPMMSGNLPMGPVINGVQANGKVKDFLVFRSQFVPKVSSVTYNLGFTKSAIGLVTRRLPLALPGTGAVQEYAELGNFGMRVTMSYAPNTLSQQFTVDVLWGAGVLRNQAGVQVKSN